MIENDAVLMGLLAVTLGTIFYTQKHTRAGAKFFKYVPTLLLCYFIPSIYNTIGLINAEESRLYFVASRYLLPTCLVLLTLSIDLPAVMRLGYKAIVMFLTGTIGIVIGGPVALILVGLISPETVGGDGPDAVWRGLTTVAGSWIGGGANMAAMKEVFDVGGPLFSQMIAVDVLCANLWLAVLLYLAQKSADIDRRMGADVTAIEDLKFRVEQFHDKFARNITFHDLMFMSAIGFGVTGIAHAASGFIVPWIENNAPILERLSLTSSFFWIVVIATTLGVVLSFSRARELEGPGASSVGSAMLYVLIATIGMHMDVTAVFSNPGLFGVGLLWIGIHGGLLILVARLIRAPVFYMAVGSQANVGGAASAPVVAAAFHPSLAPVGVLLAVLGYAVGTYAAWICGLIMRAIATT
ncbi:MAG: DUF819 family protein [Gammaproteobacteria bacterium]|nr:DUF819 family protein [Gammaproteobacteria bacterium]